jgi:hypothetical protein
MRKFFASAFALSATLALVAGLVFAWTGTATAPAGVPSAIGSVSVALQIDEYTYAPLLPGMNVKTAKGRVYNATGIPVYITGGSISPISADNAGCNGFISGSVVVTDNSWINHNSTGGGWDSYLALTSNTHQDCQGVNVNYTINVDVTT